MKKSIVPLLLLASILLNLVLLNQICKPELGEVVTDTTSVVSTFVPDSAADSSFVESRDYKIPASAVKAQGKPRKRPKIGNNQLDSIPDTCNIGPVIIPADSDSLIVTLPITQKVYSDSTYTAYVSGFDAKLDSIKVFSQMVTVTKKEPPPAFTFGVQAGYGITPAGMQPYLGLGVQYNFSLSKIWPFKKK
ncbi:MAG: hypothetical protein IJ887_00410 [Prevotella sp.]|nr:hypothetical protein [Prevotella sp.]MBR3479298.1 hypothetical protein [Prevotella sp.]